MGRHSVRQSDKFALSFNVGLVCLTSPHPLVKARFAQSPRERQPAIYDVDLSRFYCLTY
jgi:hypothetical protein